MKKILIITCMIILTLPLVGHAKNTYTVTITNLTRGQPITPPVIAVHKKGVHFFTTGEKASPGLVELAEDGRTEIISAELSRNKRVTDILIGGSVIMPGEHETFTIRSNRIHFVSIGAMLGKTNDAFVAKKSISLNLSRNEIKKYKLHVFDSGSEINNELAYYIPGFGNAGVRTQKNEGFVHPHPGIFGIADLNVFSEAFASVAAKVVIKRID